MPILHKWIMITQKYKTYKPKIKKTELNKNPQGCTKY